MVYGFEKFISIGVCRFFFSWNDDYSDRIKFIYLFNVTQRYCYVIDGLMLQLVTKAFYIEEKLWFKGLAL